MKHLINKKTGVVFVWTKALAEHKDMVLYDIETGQPVSKILPEPEPKPASEDIESEKARVAALVKKWFGRDVARVTKEDLSQYALDNFGAEISDESKLAMALEIEKLKAGE